MCYEKRTSLRATNIARPNASPMPLAPPVTKAALPTNSRITLPSLGSIFLNCGDLVVTEIRDQERWGDLHQPSTTAICRLLESEGRTTPRTYHILGVVVALRPAHPEGLLTQTRFCLPDEGRSAAQSPGLEKAFRPSTALRPLAGSGCWRNVHFSQIPARRAHWRSGCPR